MRRTFCHTRIGALALSSLLVAAGTSAQDFRGSIAGRITDGSGAVLPGATVTTTNLATNISSSATANNQGVYTILYLRPTNAAFGKVTSQNNLPRDIQIAAKVVF